MSKENLIVPSVWGVAVGRQLLRSQVARRVDVEVDAGAVGRQAGERVADETRLSVAARGDERDVAVVLDRTEQLFGLLDAIAEVFRTGVAGGQKGVFELHEGESTTTPT